LIVSTHICASLPSLVGGGVDPDEELVSPDDELVSPLEPELPLVPEDPLVPWPFRLFESSPHAAASAQTRTRHHRFPTLRRYDAPT
jgi:hypothetical protein